MAQDVTARNMNKHRAFSDEVSSMTIEPSRSVVFQYIENFSLEEKGVETVFNLHLLFRQDSILKTYINVLRKAPVLCELVEHRAVEIAKHIDPKGAESADIALAIYLYVLKEVNIRWRNVLRAILVRAGTQQDLNWSLKLANHYTRQAK